MPGNNFPIIPIFPLAGALLFPGSLLPLHVFEPRYRAMVHDALKGDRRIAMIQPRDDSDLASLYDIGCIGTIVSSKEYEDGRCDIVLQGIGRFRIHQEIKTHNPYRQVEADQSGFDDAKEPDPLASVQRAELETESRHYANALGYSVDWEAVSRLDDETFVNSIAQIAPFDTCSKQALLEAKNLSVRADLLVQLMQFQLMLPTGTDGAETLQ